MTVPSYYELLTCSKQVNLQWDEGKRIRAKRERKRKINSRSVSSSEIKAFFVFQSVKREREISLRVLFLDVYMTSLALSLHLFLDHIFLFL